MAKKKAFGIPKTLSDGIGETISTANNNVGQLRYEVVSLSRIDLDPENPRDLKLTKNDVINGIEKNDTSYELKSSELDTLQSLAHSIKKAGVRNPVELYRDNDRYILISGERRVLASLLAQKSDVPAKILDSKPDELELRFLQWIENIEREDLSIWERIFNIEQLIAAYTEANMDSTISPESLAKIIGCSNKQAKRYLDVTMAPKSLKDGLKETGISDLIKLSLIVNANTEEQRSALTSEAINGASREKLASVLKQSNLATKPKKILSRRGRGRPISSISLNIPVEKTDAVKKLVDCVLSSSNYKAHLSKFNDIDWSNAAQIKKAFQSLIDILESSK